MKKSKLFVFGLIALCAFSSSCGKPGQTGNDHAVFWCTMGQDKREALNACVEEFNKKYEGTYSIEVLYQGGNYADLAKKLSSAIPAGTNPTIAWGYPDSFSSFMGENGENGSLVNLETFMNDPELGFNEEDGYHLENDVKQVGKDDFVKAYYEEGTNYQVSGTYSLPFYKSTEVLYYNADYFNGISSPNGKKYKVPETWQEAVALSYEMIADRKAAGWETNDFYPLAYDSDANLFISQCIQRGIPYTKLPESSEDNPFVFNNSQAIALVDEISTLIKDNVLRTKGVLPNNSYTSTLFTEGKSVMTIGSTGGSDYNVSSNFDVQVAPAPYHTTKKYVMQGPSVCIFSNDTLKNQKSAWMFYKYLSSTKWNTLISLQNSYDPVRISCYETAQYAEHIASAKEENADIKEKVSAITSTLKANYFTTPVFVGSDVAREEVGNLFSYTIIQKMSAKEAIETAFKGCIIGA